MASCGHAEVGDADGGPPRRSVGWSYRRREMENLVNFFAFWSFLKIFIYGALGKQLLKWTQTTTLEMWRLPVPRQVPRAGDKFGKK